MITIIFDLDGTVLDTYGLIRETFIRLFARFLPEYTYTEADLQSFFGPPLRDTFRRIGCDDLETEKMFHEYRKLSVELQPEYLNVFPDTEETLSVLKKSGYKLAIFSNKIEEAITSGLKQVGLYEYFDMIVGIDQVKNPKPNSEGIELIRKEMQADLCIYIGDTKIDIETAKNANVDGIGVSWALTSREELLASGAKHIAGNMKELLKIVRENYV
ncbi:MAG: HAD-IA family hydrolase [Bacilli bacterium]|nr:HAD-IA family hydrolase [Bacilli bacterium]